MMNEDNHLKIIDFGTAYFFNPSLVNAELIETIHNIKKAEKSDEDIIEEYQSKHKATFVGTAE